MERFSKFPKVTGLATWHQDKVLGSLAPEPVLVTAASFP